MCARVVLPTEESLLERSWHVQPTLLGRCQSPSATGGLGGRQSRTVAQSAAAALDSADARNASGRARAAWKRWATRTTDSHPSPVICLQFVGAGRVVFQATDESYLWSRISRQRHVLRALLDPDDPLSEPSKLLGTSRTVELMSDRAQYYRGESVPLHVRFFDERMAPVADDGVVVVVEQETGRRQRIKLHRDLTRRGIFEGTVSNLAEGSYRAWIAAPTIEDNPPADDFVVVPPPGRTCTTGDGRGGPASGRQDVHKDASSTSSRRHRLLDELPLGRQVRIESLPVRARLELAAAGRAVRVSC